MDGADSFRLIDKTGKFKGKISYFINGPVDDFLTLRQLDATATEQALGTAYYSVTSPDAIFSPFFNAYGNKLNFMVGDDDYPGSGAVIYQWDFAKGDIQSVGSFFNPSAVQWYGDFTVGFLTDTSIAPDPSYWQNRLAISNFSHQALYPLVPPTDDFRFNWDRKNQLYFSAKPPQPNPKPNPKKKSTRVRRQSKKKPIVDVTKAVGQVRPNIYVATWDGRANPKGYIAGQLLIKDGMHPIVSRNGKRILYTGWLTTSPNGKVVPPGTAGAKERYGLCFWDQRTNKQLWLGSQEYTTGYWLPDGRSLMLVNMMTSICNFYGLNLNQAEIESQMPDLLPAEMPIFATWESPVSPVQATFLGLSRDGQYLFFKEKHRWNQTPEDAPVSLRAFNMNSKEVETVFDFPVNPARTTDFNWLDESTLPVRSEKEEGHEDD